MIDKDTKQLIDLESVSLEDLIEAYYDVFSEHFIERPVSYHEFITSSDFLGNLFGDSIIPIWYDIMTDIHPVPVYNRYAEVICDLPIGAMKTTHALISLCYELHKLLCLKNPQVFYNIRPVSNPIVFALFLPTKYLVANVVWEKLFGMLETPWFKYMGIKIPSKTAIRRDPTLKTKNNIFFVGGSNVTASLGQAVLSALLDEGNFFNEKSMNAYKIYNSLIRRRESRFLETGGRVPGIFWLVSSPTGSTSFVNQRKERAKGTAKIIEGIPIYKIKETLVDYSPEKFYVFVGDQHKDPQIIEKHEVDKYPSDLVYEVPTDYFDSFNSDLLASIRDILGVSTYGSMKLITSYEIIYNSLTRRNPFYKEVFKIPYKGSSFEKDILPAIDKVFFQKIPRQRPRFVHIDTGLTKDRFAIAATYGEFFPEKDAIRLFTDFIFTLQALPGQEIPFHVAEDFFKWLRSINYPIKLVTSDQYQSKYLTQNINLKYGYEVGYYTLEKKRDPFLIFKNILYQGILVAPRHSLLIKELKELEDNGDFIDHPPDVSEGESIHSKDVVDAVVGSVIQCYEFLTNKRKKAALVLSTKSQEKNVYERYYDPASVWNKKGGSIFSTNRNFFKSFY